MIIQDYIAAVNEEDSTDECKGDEADCACTLWIERTSGNGEGGVVMLLVAMVEVMVEVGVVVVMIVPGSGC